MILYEIYSRKTPYEGEPFRKTLRKIVDPRINYRPAVPACCPKRMSEIMQRCWSSDPLHRHHAKDLDMLFGEMTSRDADIILEESNSRVRTEVATGDMLYQVFPRKVADKLRRGEKVEPENHDEVTIFFSDIVRFTDISRALSPVKVCNMLDRLYLAFDALANKHEVFKVETIGDAWMGVTNCKSLRFSFSSFVHCVDRFSFSQSPFTFQWKETNRILIPNVLLSLPWTPSKRLVRLSLTKMILQLVMSTFASVCTLVQLSVTSLDR